MSDAEKFIDRIIELLDRVVREETQILSRNAIVDLREYNIRKSQGLYSLSRALGNARDRSFDAATVQKLRDLRGTLELNQRALARHLQAVREVATLISETIREAESDGTYEPYPVKTAGTSE